MKRVAVIGGGPSGLAAAKALLDVGLSPVIFEAASTVGGLWSKSSPSRRVWEHLRTNLSKYTCCFADMPWPKEAPLHPTNQQVCDYLHQYTDRFLITPFASATVNHDNTPIFHFNTKITKLSHFPETGKYLLQYTSAASDGTTTIVDNTEEFDKVVIASGFFNQHHNRSPANLSTPQASSSSGAAAISKDEMGNIIYADQYQSPEPFQGKTVIIVGASFSGCEIAAEIATVAKKVYHIVPRYSFVLPRMIPLNPLHPATPFLPLDIVFYALNEERQKQVQQHFQVIHNDKGEDAGDLASASPPFSSSSSSLSFEVLFKDLKDAEKTTSYLSQVVGTGNAHVDPLASLSSAFITSIQRGEEKPIVAISDEYKSMVRAGKIEVIAGRYVDYHPSMESGVNKTVINLLKNEESAQVLIEDSIDQTILCTGYSPDVSYLDSALRSILQYSPEHTLLPMILYKEQFHPSLPGLHFVGMYKGPYFGVMELQAVSKISSVL
jgi:cation diffusion facilitator CzcD-associated flavoprotein CzcO